MTTTPEDRIRAQFKAERNRSRYDETLSMIIFRLAQQWKRPCADIREIVGQPREGYLTRHPDPWWRDSDYASYEEWQDSHP